LHSREVPRSRTRRRPRSRIRACGSHESVPIDNSKQISLYVVTFVRLVLELLFFPLQDEPWANDSRLNLKMLFAILVDKEIEELKERAIRQRNF